MRRLLVSTSAIVLVLGAAAHPAQAAKRVTQYPIPTPNSIPISITAGPDGNLWFAERDVHKIGKITTGGVITEYPLPIGGFPWDITAGPDGALWFPEYQYVDRIGRIT